MIRRVGHFGLMSQSSPTSSRTYSLRPWCLSSGRLARRPSRILREPRCILQSLDCFLPPQRSAEPRSVGDVIRGGRGQEGGSPVYYWATNIWGDTGTDRLIIRASLSTAPGPALQGLQDGGKLILHRCLFRKYFS